MSDYLGPNQTRVLDSNDRSFETVIYQRKKPPLSCEGNLEGNLVAHHSQDIVQWVTPSGWDTVGILKDDTLTDSISIQENARYRGDVMTSPAYSANNFKLISLDKGVLTKGLIAWVNGWKILVQGTNTSDENNIIILPLPPSITYSVDFVFLEVWRKLITPSDLVLYKHGNVLYGGTNFSNDLIDPAINIETSLRIQTQYRIRTVANIDIVNNPEGFDPVKVFVQGPLPNPIDSCDQAYFSPVPGDPGLWRAGAGDTAAQETLETVDGYTYAIPMFAVARRNTTAFTADDDSNGSGRSLADYRAGKSSDRPDNKYNDWIVSSDILDLRHKISPAENLKEICGNGFDKLIKGQVQNVMKVETLGEDHAGKVLVQVDGVSSTPSPTWFTEIGGAGADDPDGYRRVWSNATYTQPMTFQVRTINDKTLGTVGGPWQIGDKVTFYTSGYPTGTIFSSVQSDYRAWLNGPGTNLTPLTVTFSLVISTKIQVHGAGTDTIEAEIQSGTIVGSSDPFTLEFGWVFPSGPNGLTAIPDTFLEFRKTLGPNVDSSSIATRDMDIRVRDSVGGMAVITTDGTRFNMLANKGAEYTEPYNFGHQMIYHVIGNGTSTITFSRQLFGYSILGVARSQISSVDVTPSSVTRNVTQYTVVFPSTVAVGADIELWLYTGTKFFDTNKQGRAIIDTLEMREFPLIGDGASSAFHIDVTGQPGISQAIIAVASNETLNGVGYAYITAGGVGTQTPMSSWVDNTLLPTDETRARINIEFASPPGAGFPIDVPILMKSAVRGDNNEGYAFFYQKTPYQGLLGGSDATGVVETSGPAITTTSGSGTITNFTYSDGAANFNAGSNSIIGLGTKWLINIQPGYLITGPDAINYVISGVFADNNIALATPYQGSTVMGASYSITANDKPSFRFPDIIDRLPTLNTSNDSTALNGPIQINGSEPSPMLYTRVMTQVQDIVGLPAGVAEIGIGTADRGRTQIVMPPEYGPLGRNNLGLRFEPLDMAQNYQKTYQTYVLNKNNNGRLYLMVVGSESGNDSTNRYLDHLHDTDTVDIFELPGRPLTNRKDL
jgi:hypothetical protein